MTQKEAEVRVKALQKEFLLWLEESLTVDAVSFEDIRRTVFRASFSAFRLGVVGLPPRVGHPEYPEDGYIRQFAGRPEYFMLHPQFMDRHFHMTLESFRLGSAVAAQKDLVELYAILDK